MKSLLNLTVCILFCAELLYSQEIDLNNWNNRDKEKIEETRNVGLFKKNSLVFEVFLMSNFLDRYTIKSQQFYENAQFEFKWAYGAQLEYFISNNFGLSLLSRNSAISYKGTGYNYNMVFNYNINVSTFSNQLILNFHVPINAEKSDLSFGIGSGISKIKDLNNDFGYEGLTLTNTFRVNYRILVLKNFGVNAAMGVDMCEGNIYNQGSIKLFNTYWQFKPSASLGITYKI
jgi:hypothetical protein